MDGYEWSEFGAEEEPEENPEVQAEAPGVRLSDVGCTGCGSLKALRSSMEPHFSAAPSRETEQSLRWMWLTQNSNLERVKDKFLIIYLSETEK